jgi:hypothetical protein
LPSSKKIVQVFCNELMQQLLLLSWEMSWAVAAGRQLGAVTKAWTPGVKIIPDRAHPRPGRPERWAPSGRNPECRAGSVCNRPLPPAPPRRAGSVCNRPLPPAPPRRAGPRRAQSIRKHRAPSGPVD